MPELDTPAINFAASAVAAYSLREVTPRSHLRSFISPADHLSDVRRRHLGGVVAAAGSIRSLRRFGDIGNFRVDFTRTTPLFKRVGSRYRAVISIFKKPMAATCPVAIYKC